MKTLGLLLRKDVRLLRVPIAVWLAVLVAQIAFPLSPLDQAIGEPGIITAWNTGSTVLTLLHFAALLLLLVGAAQADPPNVPTAFWVTRPLGPRMIMASKALFALVVVVLPFTVANSVVLAGRGFTAPDLMRAVAAGLLVQAFLWPGSSTASVPRAPPTSRRG